MANYKKRSGIIQKQIEWSLGMTFERKIANLFRLTDENWIKHANLQMRIGLNTQTLGVYGRDIQCCH